MLALILRYRLLIWWRSLRTRRGARRNAGALAAIVAVVFGLLAVQVGYTIARAADVPTAALVGVFAVFALFVLLFGISVTLTELFVASDIDLLLTAPLPQRTLFALKTIDCARAAAGIGALAFCGLIGWGLARQAGPAYYLVALVIVVVFAAGAAMLDLVLVLLLTRVLPAKRLRDAVLLVGSVVGALLVLLFDLSRPRRGSLNSLDGVADRFKPTPIGWAGHALAAVAGGDWGAAVRDGAALLALAVVLTLIGYLLFTQLFLAGLDAMRVTASGPRRSAKARARSAHATRPLPLATAIKDWRLTLRDVPYLSSLIPSLIYACAFPVVFALRARGVSLRTELLLEFGALPLVALIAAYAPALAAIAREGAAFDVLRGSPARARDVLAGKTLAVGLPVAAVVAFAGVALAGLRRAPAPMYALAIAGAAWLGIGCALIGVAIGAYNPRFDQAQHSRRGQIPTAGCLLYAAVAGLFGLGTFALVAACISALVGASSALPLIVLGAIVFAIGLAAVVAAVAVAIRRLSALLAPER